MTALFTNIKSRSNAAPPLGPQPGERYLVSGSGSGAWAGLGGQLVEWDGAWAVTAPSPGTVVWVDDETRFIKLESAGGPWVSVGQHAVLQVPFDVIGRDPTVAAEAAIDVRAGALLYLKANTTLTLHGSFSAGTYRCFNLATGARVALSGPMVAIYPQWWGATANAVQDDGPALQAAVDSMVGGTLHFPDGVYRVSTDVAVGPEYVMTFSGDARLMIDACTDFLVYSSQSLNVRWFGAINGNAQATGCEMKSGAAELSYKTLVRTEQSDFRVGGGICVQKAGPGALDLHTRIVSIDLANDKMELEHKAESAVTNVECYADNSIAIHDTIRSLQNVIPLASVENNVRRGVYFPGPDVYNICQPIVCSRPMIRFFSDHYSAAYIQAFGNLMPNGRRFAFVVESRGMGSYCFERLRFHLADNAVAIKSLGDGILIDSKVEECWFGGLTDSKRGASAIDARMLNVLVTGCTFEFLKVAIVMTRNTSLTNFTECLFYDISDCAMLARPGVNETVEQINISDFIYVLTSVSATSCVFDFPERTEQINIDNVHIMNGHTGDGSRLDAGFRLANTRRLNLSNINLRDSVRGNAIDLRGCQDVHVTNFQVHSEAAHEPQHAVFSENCSGVTFSGFTLQDSTLEAIRVEATAGGDGVVIPTHHVFDDGVVRRRGSAVVAKPAALRAAVGQLRVRRVRFESVDGLADAALDLEAVLDGSVCRVAECDFVGFARVLTAPPPFNARGQTTVTKSGVGLGLLAAFGERSGQATVNGTAEQVDVEHGLLIPPLSTDRIMVTPASALGAAKSFWVSYVPSATSTTFRIHVDAPPQHAVNFVWRASSH